MVKMNKYKVRSGELTESEGQKGYLNAAIMPLAVFVFAFLLRFLYIYQFKGDISSQCLILDLKYYNDWAMSIVRGDWLGREVFEMTPLYAYFLAFLYKFITADLFNVRLIQIFIGSLSCVLVYAIAKDVLENKISAIVAGAVAAVYGPFIFYDGMVMKPFLEVFFVLLTVLFLLRAFDNGFKYPFFAGASLGLAALLRENIIVVIPAIPLLLFFSGRVKSKKTAVFKGLFFLAGVFLIVLPVTIRNFYVSKEFVLITSGGGEVFYIGNNPEADGTYIEPEFVRPTPFLEHEDFRRKAMELTGRELTRKGASDFWFSQGVKFIMENPGRFAWLMGRKFMLFWNYYELPDNQNYYFQKTRSRVLGLPLLHFGVVAPLGFMGILLSLRRAPSRFMVLYIVFFAYMASVLLVFNFARFRLLAVSLLIIFAVYAASWFTGVLREKRPGLLLLSLLVLTGLYFASNYDLQKQGPYRLKFDTANANLGSCSLAGGRTQEAYEFFTKALEINPQYPEALAGMGDIYYMRGKPDLAEKAYISAIKADKNFARPYYGLAKLLIDAGRPEAAGEMLNRANALEN